MLARRHCANGGSEERERRDDNFTPLQLHSLARRVIYMHCSRDTESLRHERDLFTQMDSRKNGIQMNCSLISLRDCLIINHN